MLARAIMASDTTSDDAVRTVVFTRAAIGLELLLDMEGWERGLIRGFTPPKIMAR
jgi:hypothetical protein